MFPFFIYTTNVLFPYFYISQGGLSLGQLLGGQGARARVILVLRECIWNAHTVSLVLPSFDDTAPWVLFRLRWSNPLFKWFHPG